MSNYGPKDAQESLRRMAEAAATPEWQARAAAWERQRENLVQQIRLEGREFRPKCDDLSKRWKAGEVGRVIVQDPFKYDIWLDFGVQEMPEGTELFGEPLPSVRRIFGFMIYEVEAV